MHYSQELKDSILRKILPPNSESITKIAKEEGIPEQTIRNWQKQARADGIAVPGKDSSSEKWSTQDKFLIVVETAGMNETDLAEYARKKGLYADQIKAWRDACMNANGGVAREAARLNKELKNSEKERKKLEKELQRKEKALAEAAALLVLSKKANAIWNINSFAEYFMQIFTKYSKYYETACDKIARERKRFSEELSKIAGIKVYKSQANFLLCELQGKISATNLTQKLLDEYNIFIKDLSHKKCFENGKFIRLAVKSEQDDNEFLEVLRKIKFFEQ